MFCEILGFWGFEKFEKSKQTSFSDFEKLEIAKSMGWPEAKTRQLRTTLRENTSTTILIFF